MPPDVSQIRPYLYIGSAPRSGEDAGRLKQNWGITAVLSLQTDGDLSVDGLRWEQVQGWYAAAGMAAERVPIEDFSPRTLAERMDEAVEALRRLVSTGAIVYLHCTAGINRSPTIAIAYLCRVHGLPVDQALAEVRAQRPRVLPYEEVLTLLRQSSG